MCTKSIHGQESIHILDWPSTNILIDTQWTSQLNTHSTLNQRLYCTCLTLHRQLVDSQSSVDQLICIDQFDTQWHDCKNELTLYRLLTKMLFKCQARVNWGVNQISIECQSRVLINTQLRMSLVHMWFRSLMNLQ